MSKLQNETLSDEIKDYQEGIQRLSTELEWLSKMQRKLLTELEILQVNPNLKQIHEFHYCIRKLLFQTRGRIKTNGTRV